MWRQGDILIQSVTEIPADAVKRKKPVLESSQTTGHEHRVAEKNVCRMYELGNEKFLDVFADQASLVHPEHDTIELKHGKYRVWKQREFIRPGFHRPVVD